MAELFPRTLTVEPGTTVRPYLGHDQGSPLDHEAAVARASGYAAGWSRGLAEARNQVLADHEVLIAQVARDAMAERRRIDTALASLHQATSQVLAHVEPTAEEMADLVLAAAMELAESVVGHDVAARLDPGPDTLRAALAMTGEANRPVRIRMSVEDAATLSGHEVPAEVEIVSDPELSAGESIAEHAGGRAEILIADALRRAREALSQ